jgi:hypothetical protein
MRRADVRIGALQTVAKLLGPSAYFKFKEDTAGASGGMRVTGQNIFQYRVTKAGAGASLTVAAQAATTTVFQVFQKGIPK